MLQAFSRGRGAPDTPTTRFPSGSVMSVAEVAATAEGIPPHRAATRSSIIDNIAGDVFDKQLDSDFPVKQRKGDMTVMSEDVDNGCSNSPSVVFRRRRAIVTAPMSSK
jgi:hypothetical protein